MINSFVARPRGIASNMAVVKQCAYETFQGGTEVDEMDMEEKVKGSHLRGETYTVSQDGLCPRCGNSNRLYVILDKLFPMGDMPEILHSLIAKGRAILWSSQEREGYKDPPTFLCRGFCPPDPLGAGFNVNWDNVSVYKILESLDRPLQKAINPVSSPQGTQNQGGEHSSQDESSDNPFVVLDDFQGSESEVERNMSDTAAAVQSSSDKEEENDEEDDDDDELDEEELIKQMLAKEQQKLSQENSDDEDAVADDGDDDEEDGKGDDDAGKSVSEAATDSEHFSEQTLSSSNVASSVASTTTSTVKRSSSTTSSTSASSTASQYPVSSTGRCPYCGSSDVKYIIVVSENTKDSELPQSLQQLLTGNHAFKMAKGDSEPPSFQCQKCQYGFNLNWSMTNLEMIFGLSSTTTSAATSAATPYKSTPTTAFQTPHAPYIPPAVYSPYHRPSVPPPGYPPPVSVPPPMPPVPHLGFLPTYPGYYGSYYPPAPFPPPIGSYPPYTPPTIPPPGVPYARIPPPVIPPPGIAPPGIVPLAIPPPRIPPPGIPPPGIPPPGIPPLRTPPPGLPPPGIPPPAIPRPALPPPRVPPVYPAPAVSSIPPPTSPVMSNYAQSQSMPQVNSRYPPTSASGYRPPSARLPSYPGQQHVRPQRPGVPQSWYQAPGYSAATAAATAQQNVATGQEAAGDVVNDVAAARFEMVLNQIDRAKARVRNEKDKMIEFQKAVQQLNEEPNALTDEGQKMPEFEEKPPGDEDIVFGSSEVISEASALEKDAELPLNASVSENSASLSEVDPSGFTEQTDAFIRENDAIARDIETLQRDGVATTANDAVMRDLSDDSETVAVTSNITGKAVTDAGEEVIKDSTTEDEPETLKTTTRAAQARRGRSGRSTRQEKLSSPPTAVPTRQTRRSRRSEPTGTDTTEDAHSTSFEEEVMPVTGKTRKSRMTKPVSEKQNRLGMRNDNQESMQGGVDTSDTDIGESSDVLSQSSSVVPQTESDSVPPGPSDSLPSSSETETADVDVARQQPRRQTRGRKRMPVATIAEPSLKKVRQQAAEEEEHNKDKESGVGGGLVDNPPIVTAEGEVEMADVRAAEEESPRLPSSQEIENVAMDTGKEELTELSEGVESGEVTQERKKQPAKTRTKRQTRKSAVQLPQEPEVLPAKEILVSPTTEGATHECEASTAELSSTYRRTRKSTPQNVTPETAKGASNRRTRKSAQLTFSEPDTSDIEQGTDNVKTQLSSSYEGGINISEDIQEEEEEIKPPSPPQQRDEKPTRRTRQSRNLPMQNEDVPYPQTNDADSSAVEEDPHTPRTRKTRKSLVANEDSTNVDVQVPVESDMPEENVSSRRPRRIKSKQALKESTDLSQESDEMTAEGDVEEKPTAAAPQRKLSKKMTSVQSPETVTKRVTRARQKK